MKMIKTYSAAKLRLLKILFLSGVVFYTLAYSEASGQNQKFAKGIVVNEEGTPLQGVKVIVARSLTSVVTDARGRFAISNIPDGSSLMFSCKGYRTYTMPPLMASNSALYIRLVKDPEYKEPPVSNKAETDYHD